MKDRKKINLFWWQKESVKNFGDILTPIIISELSNNKVRYVYPSHKIGIFILDNLRRLKIQKVIKVFIDLFRKKIFAIGSIINYSDKKTIVWGSGIMNRNDNIKGGDFVAVRGHESRKRLTDLGFNAPNIVGDPALLLRKTHKVQTKPIYELGIIPHYVDYQYISKVTKEKKISIPIINFLNTNPLDVIEQICLCKKIVSSSLHGIIVSHTYNIPALWCLFSDKVYGDGIKYYDYFSSVDIEYYNGLSLELNSSDTFINNINSLFERYKNQSLPATETIDKICDELLLVAPFKVKDIYKSTNDSINF